ncbi:MAG: acylphosphatase [Candidatus Peribacter sp.]|jgi:acylphosphatase|nr:acylphosphatase [Candidatus Peribacter sp.]MBT4392798.1 acylphosphatase [Candidatus Peribacter sp.]MBT4600585.1 acylphosphatase [Candidatus Peribacter sp.]MBT5148746.1 acylphosphatase [Candidatus Peribacter sp.]MBT5637659.1 acylphosphatase [Candidatus Peribacter sp.]
MIAKQIRVNGLVQGVFFRVSTKEKADELGVKGWVRNCRRRSDSVKIFAEGEEEAIQKFLDWCHKGPENAEVEEVEVAVAKPKNSSSFEVTD